MNKSGIILVSVIVFFIIIIVVIGNNKKINNSTSDTQGVENSIIKDGVQYITIKAGGGYSPKISNAKAGIPTKLIVKTNGTFDCSSSLVIRALGFQKILPQTGDTEIDIGTPKTGEPLQGVCGMGMYNFLINFN